MYRKLKKRILWLVAAVMLAGLCFPGMEVMNVRAEESSDTSQDEYGKGIKIKDMWLEGDTELSNLKAGDAFEITLLLYNDSDKDATVRPNYCSLTWRKKGESASDSPKTLSCDGTYGAYLLSPGEEKELTLEMQIGKYESVGGEWQLQYINLNDANGALTSTVYFYDPDRDNTKMTGRCGGNRIEDLPYAGEMDFTVASSETLDTEPPFLGSISVTPAEVKAPGNVQLKFKTQGEIAPITDVSVRFMSEDNLSYMLVAAYTSDEKDEFYYSDAEECYIVEYTVPETTLEGTYTLDHLSLHDEAGNYINYMNSDGKLVDQSGEYTDIPKVDTCKFTVTETEMTDRDFTAPRLAGIEVLNPELSASDTLKVRIQAEEETGISSVTMTYVCDNSTEGTYNSYLTIHSKSIVKEETGYICEFDIVPYCAGGVYDFESILLTDTSLNMNGSWSYYDKRSNLVTGGNQVSFSPQTSLSLSVTQAEDMLLLDIRTDNIAEKVKNTEEGTTVVVQGSLMDELEIRLFTAEFWNVVKEKDLTVIVPDEKANAEIVVKGADIKKAVDLELKVQREDRHRWYAGTPENDIYYPVHVATTDASFPITVRIRIEQDFLHQCGENPLRISRVYWEGDKVPMQDDLVLIKDNLKVTDDGYLEINFPNGLQETGIATKTLDEGTTGKSLTSQVFSFFVTPSTKTSSVTKGDISGDGQINLVDLMQCLNHVGRKEILSGEVLQAADIDQNGNVNLVDLMRLLNYVGRKAPSL